MKTHWARNPLFGGDENNETHPAEPAENHPTNQVIGICYVWNYPYFHSPALNL
jgi:hypothetical protein